MARKRVALAAQLKERALALHCCSSSAIRSSMIGSSNAGRLGISPRSIPESVMDL